MYKVGPVARVDLGFIQSVMSLMLPGQSATGKEINVREYKMFGDCECVGFDTAPPTWWCRARRSDKYNCEIERYVNMQGVGFDPKTLLKVFKLAKPSQ